MTKTVECSSLLTLELTLNYLKTKIKLNMLMVDKFDETLISLLTLTFLIIFSLSWLVLRTLKEGRKALTEMNKDRW